MTDQEQPADDVREARESVVNAEIVQVALDAAISTLNGIKENPTVRISIAASRLKRFQRHIDEQTFEVLSSGMRLSTDGTQANVGREAVAMVISEGNPPDHLDYGAADAVLAAFEVRLRGTATEPNEAEDAARVRRINDLRQARDAVSGALAHRMHQTDPEMFFLAVRQMLNSTRYLVDGYAPDAEARS